MPHLIATTIGLLLLSTNILCCEIDCGDGATDCCKNSTDCCTNSTDCCSKSCCQTSSYCCQRTSNCCQRISNCCNICSTRCRTSTCANQCKKDCCTNDKKEDNKTEKVTDNESKQTIVERRGDSNVNTNNNTFNLTTSVNLNNTVNTENRIFIPINISNSNINSVVVASSGGGVFPITVRPTEHTTSETISSPTPATTTTPCQTVKVPVPVPVPGKPIYVPIPYPITYPQPQPNNNCCIIVSPCSSYGCDPYQRTCGLECSHHVMYRPIDPCEGHCHRRWYAFNRYCYGSGYCRHSFTNCAQCDMDFYQSYDSYQQCGGCFYR